MIIVGFIICMLSVLVDGQRRYGQYYNQHKFHLYYNNQSTSSLDRIIVAVRTYVENGIIRVQEIKQIRWLYEQSPEYETGYVMGDIIERYKKLVEAARRAHFNAFYNDTHYENDLFHLMSKLEHVQKLYFEVYHLVRMLHEIPKKFEHEIVTKAPDMAALQFLKELKEAQETVQKLQSKRLQRQREERKARNRHPNWTGTTLSSDEAANSSKPYNIWWPLDYGWEIDAYGW